MAAVGPALGDAPPHSRAGQQVAVGSGGGVGGPLTPPGAYSMREGGLSGRLSPGSRSAGRRRLPRLHPRIPRCVPACGPALPAPCRLRLPPSRCCQARNPGSKQSPARVGRLLLGAPGLGTAAPRRRSGAGPPALPVGRPDSGGEPRIAPGVREPAGHGALAVPHSRQRSCPALSGAGRVRGAGAVQPSGGVAVCLGFMRLAIQRYRLSKELRACGEIQSI